MIQIILSLVPLLIFSVIFYIKGFKIKNIIHLIFCGIISLIMSLLLIEFLENIIPSLSFFLDYGNAFTKFIALFICAGFTEELSRYVALKISNPKTKNEVFINILYISLVFSVFENYGYIGMASNPLKLGMYRMLSPGHELFAVIMVYFLWKARSFRKENKNFKGVIFECLALIVPMVIHTLFDYILMIFNLNINNMNILLLILLGIITYGIPIYIIFKLNKKEESVVEKKSNKFFKIVELIIIILYVLFNFFAFDLNINDVKFNETLIIEEENIEITINEVEEIEVHDSIFDNYNGTYVKVNLTIKNRSDDKVSVIGFWNLVNNKTAEKISSTSNYVGEEIDFEIPANSATNGNIYFEAKLKADYKLQYSSRIFDKDSLEIIEKKYEFLLK